MISSAHFLIDRPANVSVKFQHALTLLTEGARYAESTGGDVWDFAVEIDQFLRIGLTPNDLRFLVRLQYLDHAMELTIVGHERRHFRRAGSLHFTRRSCFVLTPPGSLAARTLLDMFSDDERATPQVRFAPAASPFAKPAVPQWDAGRHTLFFRDRIVKQFKWHAANQFTILSAFEEEGWPGRIDDPLVPSPSVYAKRRLSDTIKCLNRKQRVRLVHFHGDGTGQGVTWEAAATHD
jgi:hypothetical protein